MKHVSVLLRESIEGLQIEANGIYVDGTLGRGGHSLEIAKRLKTGKLIAIDCDCRAIDESKKRLEKYKDKITYVQGNFRDIAKILEAEKTGPVDGAIFDLGVSSPQLDDAQRGFSYKTDSRLDMRMDQSNRLSAFEIVNTYQQNDLSKIFFMYGEEKYSRQIAKQIIKRREKSPVNTTFELNDIIVSAIPAAARREKQHPSKRCFQALRICVGDELGALKEMLDTVPALLKQSGRICVITFHSLEDKIVKKSFADYATDCICEKSIPVCICKKTPILKIITKKPITAGLEEIEYNPRARSAKLRIAEKF